MRILWFSGVELPAVSGNKLKRGGWIEGYRVGLERYFPDVQLGIASYSDLPYPKLKYQNAEYFAIMREKHSGKLQEAIHGWKHQTIYESEIMQFMKIIDQFAPDLIHIHGTENPFGLMIEKPRFLPYINSSDYYRVQQKVIL